jgi:FMN phosphatase YigB (HAD superfamily)
MKRVITVDFDETLVTSYPTAYGGSSLHVVPKIDKIIRDEHSNGADVYIVSFRKDKDRKEMENIVMFYKIPVKGIVNTNMQPKLPFLKKLNSRLHIDDDLFTCQEAKKAGIDVRLVDQSGNLIKL